MRVISGTRKRLQLHTVSGMHTRPTQDRIKETLFNMIQNDLCDAQFLDVFAGSGQMGIEALSRGAARADFVDERRDALDIVRENLRRTHLAEKAELVQGDYLSYLDRCKRRFRLIFLDPPYAEKYLENSLKRISEIDILAEGGIIITERPKEKPLDGAFSGLARSKDYLYGKTAITLFRREEDAI